MVIKFYVYEIMKSVLVGDEKYGEIGILGWLVVGGFVGGLSMVCYCVFLRCIFKLFFILSFMYYVGVVLNGILLLFV